MTPISHDDQRRLELEGAKLAPLVTGWTWIDRRVESVGFLDDVAARRQVSVTFTLPSDFEPVAGTHDAPVFYVPLTLIGKSSLTHFDFEDEGGGTLPLLTAREKGALAAGLLIALAADLLSDHNLPLPDGLSDDLRTIAQESSPQVAAALHTVLKARKGSNSAEVLNGGARKAKVLRALMRALALNYLVIVPLSQGPHAKRVIKFSYDERVRRRYRSSRLIKLPPPFLTSLLRSIGWQAKRFWFPTPAIGQGGTYHFQITAPSGLKITEARLVAMVPDEESSAESGNPRRIGEVTPRDDARNEPHVFFRDAPPGASGVVYVKTRARGSATIRSAFITALGTRVVLAVGLVYLEDLLAIKNSSTREAAATLLLAGPAIAAVYISSSSEHLMTTFVLFGVRLLTLLSGMVSFIAAGAVVLADGADSARDVWVTCTTAAGLIAVVLAVTVFATWKEDEPLRKHVSRYRAKPKNPHERD